MKTFLKFWLVTVCLFIPEYLFSQNFINETKQWNIVTSLFETTNYYTSIYQFSGDSVLNGKTYHKLYESTDSNQLNWSFNSLWHEKNDSVHKYNSTSGMDELIYDFNINVGDTFEVNDFLSMKVDSVGFKNWGGILRKCWYLNITDGYSPITTVWVEGIGQTGYFIRPTEIDITGAFVELLCFHENGDVIYQNPGYNSCYMHTSAPIIEKLSDVVKVYVTGENMILVHPLSNYPGIIEVYNITGNKIVQMEIKLTESKIRLPSKGTYIYRFISQPGEIQTGKVVVK